MAEMESRGLQYWSPGRGVRISLSSWEVGMAESSLYKQGSPVLDFPKTPDEVAQVYPIKSRQLSPPFEPL